MSSTQVFGGIFDGGDRAGGIFDGGVFSGGAKNLISECDIYNPYKSYMRQVVSPAWKNAVATGYVNPKVDSFTRWYADAKVNPNNPSYAYFSTRSYPQYLDYIYPSNDPVNGAVFQKYKMDYLKNKQRKDALLAARRARGQGLVVGTGEGFPPGVVPGYCRGNRGSSGHLSGYQAYVKGVYDEAKRSNPGVTGSQLMKIIAQVWNTYTDTKKEEWSRIGAKIPSKKRKTPQTGTQIRGRKKIYKRLNRTDDIDADLRKTYKTDVLAPRKKVAKFHTGASTKGKKKLSRRVQKALSNLRQDRAELGLPVRRIPGGIRKPRVGYDDDGNLIKPVKQTAKSSAMAAKMAALRARKAELAAEREEVPLVRRPSDALKKQIQQARLGADRRLRKNLAARQRKTARASKKKADIAAFRAKRKAPVAPVATSSIQDKIQQARLGADRRLRKAMQARQRKNARENKKVADLQAFRARRGLGPALGPPEPDEEINVGNNNGI